MRKRQSSHIRYPWQTLTTPQLAEQLEGWKNDGRDVCLLIGGPEGLSPECKAAAEQSWSLSPLTLPHPLVRVVVAESLYRAWSLTQTTLITENNYITDEFKKFFSCTNQ